MDRLINGKINLLVYMRDACLLIGMDWRLMISLFKSREDEAKAAGADINSNAVSCLAIQE